MASEALTKERLEELETAALLADREDNYREKRGYKSTYPRTETLRSLRAFYDQRQYRDGAIEKLLNESPVFTGQQLVRCTTCDKSKRPFGRDAPMASANSYCDSDCDGYREPPLSNVLWPGERVEDYGFPEELAKFARELRDVLKVKEVDGD